MKTIEINTAQKVAIQYELATLSNRFFAYLIDFLIMSGTIIVLSTLGNSLISDWNDYLIFIYLVLAPIFVFYTLVSEIMMDGQTIGKKSMGLKVIKLNGDAPGIHDYFMRWMFRFVDIFMSLGSIGALMINASPKSQRLGGLLSGTTVIRMTSKRQFKLSDILKVPSSESHTITYPKIASFNEKDILFIKRVSERERRYPNPAHKKAMNDLSAHIAKQLGLDATPNDSSKFIRTLINDYVVLTR